MTKKNIYQSKKIIGEEYKIRGDKIINSLPYEVKGVSIFGVTDKKTNKDFFIVHNEKADTYHKLNTKQEFKRLNSQLYGSSKYKIITKEKLESGIK